MNRAINKRHPRTWILGLMTVVLLIVQVVAVYSEGASEPNQPIISEGDEPMPVPVIGAVESSSLGGYASKLSVVPGESLNFHISTNYSVPISLLVYREGANRELVHTIDNVSVSQHDCTGKYDTGCDWPVTLTFSVPSDWISGVYTVEIPVKETESRHIMFWVRESVPGENGQILFLSSVNTYNAYNNYAGKSLYHFNSTDSKKSSTVSFDRPFQDYGFGQYWRWDGKFVTWTEANGYPVAYAANHDLHFIPSLLEAYDVVIISGHSEYWTWEMRQRMKQYIDGGGRLVNLSGNTMWRQIRYLDDGRTMVGYLPTNQDPVQSQILSSGPNWLHPIKDVSFSITGAHWPFGGYKPDYGTENGGYWIQNANHWVFEGTGLQENDILGRTSNPDANAIHDHEADGMPFNCSPDGSTIISPVGNSGTAPTFTVLGLAPLLYPPKDMYNIAVMGIYTVDGGGAVFSANTTGWVRALGDPDVSRVTSNVLDKFLEQNIPQEPAKADATYLFYDRFNCDNLDQNRFSDNKWLPTIHRYNYYKTSKTDTNRLLDSCGVDGSGLRLSMGNSRDGMSYQSMLKPNWGPVNTVANRMHLDLSSLSLNEGARFNLVRYYDEGWEDTPTVRAVLQLGKLNGQTVMRFQPEGANLPWRVVPNRNFFEIATWWDKPNNQIVLWIDEIGYSESVDLAGLPDLDRADFGMMDASGTNGGSICLDELIFDDQLLATEPVPTPSPTPTSEFSATPTSTSAAPTVTATPGTSGSCAPDPGNILSNQGFENGLENWFYNSNGSGSFSVSGPAFQCESAARLNIVKTGSQMQFFQRNFPLKADTLYRLSFAAYSNTGHDLRVMAHKHTSPYTNFGLSSDLFDLGSSWQVFSTEFTTSGFSGTTSDVRLRFWLSGAARNGDIYWIDDVQLQEVGESPVETPTGTASFTSTPVPSLTSTATSSPSPTNTPVSGATATPTPENTPTPTDTPAASATPSPTATNTAVPTNTNTPVAPTATSTPEGIGACTPDSGNVLSNPGFEEGTVNWSFHTSARGSFTVSEPAAQCALAARVYIEQTGKIMQFFQSGFPLKADTTYRLSFDANSNTGHDLRAMVIKHTSPYSNYGLSSDLFEIGTTWQTFSTEFTTSGFTGPTSDTRLRFWFNGPARDRDVYWIDDVRLEEVGVSPTATPTNVPTQVSSSTPTPTSEYTATPTNTAEATETATATAEYTATPTSTPTEIASPTDTATPTDTPSVPTATPTPEDISSCTVDPGNILSNPGFEEGTANWYFYTSGRGGFTVSGPAYQCESAARVYIEKTGKNMQFFQVGFPLKADTTYRLSFSAYSNTGHDLRVMAHKQSAPYTNYGLSSDLFDLSATWQTFATEFTTSGFSGTTSDVRLRFWFNGPARDRDVYWIDDVRLEEVSSSSGSPLWSWISNLFTRLTTDE